MTQKENGKPATTTVSASEKTAIYKKARYRLVWANKKKMETKFVKNTFINIKVTLKVQL